MSSHISPQSDSTPSPGTARSAGATAVFTLDRSGTILSANAGAGNFWQTESTELVGKPFVSLFAFEVTSDDPDMLEAQWDVLCSSAVEQRIPLAIQLVEGGPQTEVRVELESAAGSETAWFARVVRASKSGGSETSPATPLNAQETEPDIWAKLAHGDAAGFFDLNFDNGETYYSTAWKRLLGYGDDDLANSYDTWLKLIHPDDSAAAPDQI